MPTRNSGGRPSTKQLNYLKDLARRAGQSFTWPKTAREASREIDRLKRTPRTTRNELAIERRMEAPDTDATRFRRDEVQGYGSNARWA